MVDLPQSIWWGLLPGFITASTGAYKDTLFEPFELIKFFRSPIVCFLWYIVIDKQYPTEPVLLKLGLASTLERISVETWKAIYRPEPGKFKSCQCVLGECQLQKDRGWFLQRIGL